MSLVNDLVAHLKSLEWTRTKMERLLSEGAIVRRDIEKVYKGLYLDAITSFEGLVEELFLGLLVGRLVSGIAGVHTFFVPLGTLYSQVATLYALPSTLYERIVSAIYQSQAKSVKN
jgi:hypothetical protein